MDLSDEPVLGPRERMLLASRVLAAGLRYEGADFQFTPPPYASFPLPSLAVIGTGKRVGKTAVTGHVARLLARDRDVVVVAMGRGGPAEPQIAARAADARVAAGPFESGTPRRFGLSRDGGTHRRRHDRLPPRGRWAGRCGDHLERPARCSPRGRARAGRRRLRRQRCGDPADGRRCADSRQRPRPRSACVPQCVPRARLGSRGARRRRRRRGDPRAEEDASPRSGASSAPDLPAGRTACRGVHHRRSADGPSRRRSRQRVAQPRRPLRSSARISSERTPTSISSRSRRRRSTSWPSRRRREACEVVFAENEVVSPELDDAILGLVPAGARA